MITEIEGIILSETPYGETSKIINILTKEKGILGIMCKGAKSMKSPLRALTMPITYAKCYIYYKEDKLSTLVSWANSLKNNDRLKSIIKKGEQSTEINENVFIYKIYKYLMELCDAYKLKDNMLKDKEPQKKARRKAINNAFNRLINLLYVMIGDPKGRTIYHKGKRLRDLNINDTIVPIIKAIIKLLNVLKRKS